MFTYLFDGFLRRVFSLLRVDRILYIYNALAWRHRFFFLSKILSAFFTWSLGPRSCILSRRSHLQNWFSFTLFPLTGRRCHSCFRVLANHFASIFFLPLSVDSLGPLSLSPGHRMQTSVGFHSDPHSYFLRQAVRNWPILLSSLNGNSLDGLLIQTQRGREHSLSLSSQWSTTWQYNIYIALNCRCCKFG